MAKKAPKVKAVNENLTLSNKKKVSDRIVKITALNEEQRTALRAINENQVSFLIGMPGTGKTCMAVGFSLQELQRGKFERVIFTRPYVEAGEKLGYLPGNFDAKTAPFMMPMYDVVRNYFDEDDILEMVNDRRIVVLPFAYMRGVNFKNCCVVVDEAQNCTPQQMHLLLTRICEGTKVIITGDIYQSDLRYQLNGLLHAIKQLHGIENLEFVELTYASCVRAKIVQDIDARYRRHQPTAQNLSDLIASGTSAETEERADNSQGGI